MADVSGSYFRDWKCTKIATPIVTGKAVITGTAAEQSRWAEYNYQSPLGSIYAVKGRELGIDEMELSGGSNIWDDRIPQTRPTGDNIEYDKISNAPGVANIYNPVFIGHNTDYGFVLAISCNESGSEYEISLCKYSQTPETGTRQTWNYYTGQYDWNPYWALTSNPLENAPLIKQFKTTLWNKEFFMLAVGVKDDGTYDRGDLTHTGSLFILIPEEYYEQKEESSYVGPETEDASSSSFFPSRNPYRDNIVGYDLTSLNKDPLGLCSGTGTTHLVEISIANYSDLVEGIYTGTASSTVGASSLEDLAQAAVLAYMQAGGRAYDQIQLMLSAIQTIHIVPNLHIQTDADVSISALGGYALGKSIPARKLTSQMSTPVAPLSKSISPQTASFLNYGPYTSATLVLPWIGYIDIDPSELYAVLNDGRVIPGTISIEYAFDALTGLLTVYTKGKIVDPVSKEVIVEEHVINLSQANVATEVPLSGLGRASETSALRGLASSLAAAQAISSGNIYSAAGAIISKEENDIDCSRLHSVSNRGIGSIAPYFSPTKASLILTYPKTLNSGRYTKDFGCVSNKSGKVKEFTGYAEFANVNLSGVSANQAVKEQILSQLRGGVII